MKQKLTKFFSFLLLLSLVFFVNGCCKKKLENGKNSGSSLAGGNSQSSKGSGDIKVVSATEKPLKMLEETGLNYSISGAGKKKSSSKRAKKSSFFEEKYLKGISCMEKGKYSDALSLFEEIVSRYPNSEEASIAALCIAEMHFRNKSNKLALQAYKEVVAKYPNSHAAENARQGIEYLENFDKYEKSFISPDVEDKRRRGYR